MIWYVFFAKKIKPFGFAQVYKSHYLVSLPKFCEQKQQKKSVASLANRFKLNIKFLEMSLM